MDEGYGAKIKYVTLYGVNFMSAKRKFDWSLHLGENAKGKFFDINKRFLADTGDRSRDLLVS